MNSLRIFFLLLMMLFFSESYTMNEDTVLMNLLPEGNPAMPVESEEIYTTNEELYNYINGGAELYLNYGFIKLAKRIYKLGEENEIKAEIFDLGSAENAFGVFSYSKDTVNSDIGQGAQYIGGSLIFWQDRYFVSIFTQRETPQSKEKAIQIGKKISQSIGKESSLPPVFHIMPGKSLVEGSTFFFHHHAWQNKFRYISNDNIFNINENVRALLNQYGKSENRYYLFLMEYPYSKKARKAFKKGTKHFSKALRKKQIIELEGEKWIGCDLRERLLIFVLDAPSRDKARYLLEKTAENYSKIK
jgi:hypothetical protein